MKKFYNVFKRGKKQEAGMSIQLVLPPCTYSIPQQFNILPPQKLSSGSSAILRDTLPRMAQISYSLTQFQLEPREILAIGMANKLLELESGKM